MVAAINVFSCRKNTSLPFGAHRGSVPPSRETCDRLRPGGNDSMNTSGRPVSSDVYRSQRPSGETIGDISLKRVWSSGALCRVRTSSVQTSNPVAGFASANTSNRPSGDQEVGTGIRSVVTSTFSGAPAICRLPEDLPRVGADEGDARPVGRPTFVHIVRARGEATEHVESAVVGPDVVVATPNNEGEPLTIGRRPGLVVDIRSVARHQAFGSALPIDREHFARRQPARYIR